MGYQEDKDVMSIEQRILKARDEAKAKAIDNLARYKFSNFGYYSARWVTLNALVGDKQPNPFKSLVLAARSMR